MGSDSPFPGADWPDPRRDGAFGGQVAAAAGASPGALAVTDRLATRIGGDRRQGRRRLARVFGAQDLAEILVGFGFDVQSTGVFCRDLRRD